MLGFCGGAKRDTGHPADHKSMKVGGQDPAGVAIHDDHATTRFRHASFPLTLAIGIGGGKLM